jgi:hypothetical protein
MSTIGSVANALNSRDHQGNQNADDRDNRQQLYQGERLASPKTHDAAHRDSRTMTVRSIQHPLTTARSVPDY